MLVKRFTLILTVVVLLAFLTSCSFFSGQPAPTSSNASLTVTFLDVGQADCTLVQDKGRTLLIDAGTNDGASKLVSSLKHLGVSRIDVLVGTHPHEDHIGGLDSVVKSFSIGSVYLPDVTNTTRTYMDVLAAISAKDLKISVPEPQDTFVLDSAVGTFLAPIASGYDDMNNYSIVIRLKFGRDSFLFTGDAQVQSEKEMLAAGFDLQAEVLKVGHHGSSSSTSAAFLAAVSPVYAVIFVGAGNDYGHPHTETLQKLAAASIKVFRTDLNGDITFTSDGTGLSVRTGR